MTWETAAQPLARRERALLADLFTELGPDEPTLDEGWRTRDLLSHLIVRDGRPDVAVAAALPPLRGRAERVVRQLQQRPWAQQVQRYRSGPPGWNPMGWGKLDELANGVEMFVHHEDARRGQPDWQPRDLDAAATAELRTALRGPFLRLVLRRCPVGLVADTGDGDPIVLRKGTPRVTLVGAPGEVVLWATGRDAVVLELAGDAEAVATVRTVKRSL
jgi:uncharacterized protein (TIGR03085 family)